MKGFRVVSITASGLKDDSSVGEPFDRLALFLGQSDYRTAMVERVVPWGGQRVESDR